jgi:hypothetical protein
MSEAWLRQRDNAYPEMMSRDVDEMYRELGERRIDTVTDSGRAVASMWVVVGLLLIAIGIEPTAAGAAHVACCRLARVLTTVL